MPGADPERPWTRLFFDRNWAEFHDQPEGSPTEGMVPLFEGHRSFDGETTEYDATIAGFAPDVPTARLYGAADDLAAALEAQEVFVQLNGERNRLDPYPNADDARYTPYIGEWDGQANFVRRLEDMALCVREMRRAALAKACGEETTGC